MFTNDRRAFGYPGGNEADHDQLIDFIEEMQFNRLGYLPILEGTHMGHKPEDDVPQEVKAGGHLYWKFQGCLIRHNQKHVGQTITALVDE